MTHDCFNHLGTAIRKGRASYACSVVGGDVSLEWYFYQQATRLRAIETELGTSSNN
jgi:hypothetical protein